MQVIKGYQFDLDKSVYLNSPKNKFWEATINDKVVKYRAGVIREQQQHKIKEVLKEYQTHTLAHAKVLIKISEKISKGYFSTTAKVVQQNVPQKKIKAVRRQKLDSFQQTKEESAMQTPKKSRKGRKSKNDMDVQIKDPHKRLWKGFQKGDQVVEFDLVGNKLTTTKKTSEGEASQEKVFPSYDSAVTHIHRKEGLLTKEGFKPVVSQVFQQQQQKNESIKKETSSDRNPFASEKSLTNMTNKAIESNSFLNCEDSSENVYQLNKNLGPPTEECIKCLLAENYKEGTDPKEWIMSQKLDGVRCLWTGTEMYSRNGNKFYFPNFFTKNWPKSQLDGEIFIGRGKFSETLSAVKKSKPISTEWQKLRYLVFDAPGLKEPFSTRIKVLEEELAKIDNPFIKCHAHRTCEGFQDLFKELESVNIIGGQGIMLRQPKALYENKRSKNLQKVKTFHDDQAEIIGYTAGTGRCTGWIGAFRVRNGKGIQFQVGSGLTDEMRKNPPEIGEKITYKYQQFNKDSGKPRFPTFLRMFNPS